MLASLWSGLSVESASGPAGPPAAPMPVVDMTGPEVVLPARFDVTGLAADAIALAAAGAAELLAVRTDSATRPVSVDRRGAAAAFLSTALFAPDGWTLPPAWDPIAGDYQTRDGWIRLHTNYAQHRDAVARVLGSASARAQVAAAVGGWTAEALETAVVEAGGAAAAMRTRQQWLATEAGAATASEPAVHVAGSVQRGGAAAFAAREPSPTQPFAGVRVLDLTRVIAGPVATRFLAAYGADVLRVDPVGFEEVPALLPDMTAGKRCTSLDLRSPEDRSVMDDLLSRADVIVSGLRPSALPRLGYGPERFRELAPGAVVATLDAYGWAGPWAQRRGFDSLVQMSCGIAAPAEGAGPPDPLPAQALDYATGYLLAAAIGRALAARVRSGTAADLRASLIGTANLLLSRPAPLAASAPPPVWTEADTEPVATAWGPARRVPVPGRIDAVEPAGGPDAGPLGRDWPQWI